MHSTFCVICFVAFRFNFWALKWIYIHNISPSSICVQPYNFYSVSMLFKPSLTIKYKISCLFTVTICGVNVKSVLDGRLVMCSRSHWFRELHWYCCVIKVFTAKNFTRFYFPLRLLVCLLSCIEFELHFTVIAVVVVLPLLFVGHYT